MTKRYNSFKDYVNTHKRWFILVIVGIALLLITLDNSILYTALPTLIEELGANHSESLWIINAYPLVMAGLLLGSGTLGDRVGHKKLFVVGLVIFGIASLLAAFSPNAAILIASRAVLAVGAAAMMPQTLAILRHTFKKRKELNIAIAIWGTLAVIGAALGPIVGGLLLERFWWGSVFLLNVPFVIISLVGTLALVSAGRVDKSQKWDFISSAQFMVGLTGLVLLIKEITKTSPDVPLLLIAIAAMVLGLGTFIYRQNTLKQPLLDLGLFKNQALLAGVIGASLSMFAIAGMQLLITQRFQLVADYTPLQAGLVAATVALGSLVSGLVGGAALYKVGLRRIIAGGFAIATIGALLLIFSLPSLLFTVVGLVITGVGLGFVMSVASTAIIGNVPIEEAGMGSSVNEVSFEMGSLTAVAVLGSLVVSVFSTSLMLPSGVPEVAREGITEALTVASTVANGGELVKQAGIAYDYSFSVIMIVITIVLAASFLATLYLLRKHGKGTEVGAHH